MSNIQRRKMYTDRKYIMVVWGRGWDRNIDAASEDKVSRWDRPFLHHPKVIVGYGHIGQSLQLDSKMFLSFFFLKYVIQSLINWSKVQGMRRQNLTYFWTNIIEYKFCMYRILFQQLIRIESCFLLLLLTSSLHSFCYRNYRENKVHKG